MNIFKAHRAVFGKQQTIFQGLENGPDTHGCFREARAYCDWSGNVREWAFDWWSLGPHDNSIGPGSGERCVNRSLSFGLRVRSFSDAPTSCRASPAHNHRIAEVYLHDAFIVR